MIQKNKIFILLPDGLSLRNFAFTNFYAIASDIFNLFYWHKTPFNLNSLNLSQIKLNNTSRFFLSEILKSSYIRANLLFFSKKFKDPVYKTYIYQTKKDSLIGKLKHLLIVAISRLFSNKLGLYLLRKFMYFVQKNTLYYKNCLKTLKSQKPDFVFCTNQRPVEAIAPLLAAQKLKIPTATFIFSWDNLPKATLIIKADYYFVWSFQMQQELLKYYPNINSSQVLVTGTPQFEPHFNPSLAKTKTDFFSDFKLNLNQKYICFSGDDITTSPYDPMYLNDLAETVQMLNAQGQNLAIIFRRSPVDFSNRYEAVIKKFETIIKPIAPNWIKQGDKWHTILPTAKDNQLLLNTLLHTEAVVNLGSSMVFDAICHTKPCIYINYDVKNKAIQNWSVHKIYNYVHFRSMPNQEAVYWATSKQSLEQIITNCLNHPQKNILRNAQNWFKIVAGNQPHMASHNICNAIKNIINS